MIKRGQEKGVVHGFAQNLAIFHGSPSLQINEKSKIWQNYFISGETLKKKSFLIKQKRIGRLEFTYREMKYEVFQPKQALERGQWHHFKK